MIDPKILQEVKERARVHPIKRTLKQHTIYALDGFNSPFRSIKLNDGVVIKKASIKEKDAFFNRVEGMGGKSIKALRKNDFFLHHYCEWTCTTRDTFDEPGPYYLEKFKQMFRLFKDEHIDIQFYKRHIYIDEERNYQPAGFVRVPSSLSYSENYEISKKEINTFKRHCKKFLVFDFDKAKKLDIASKRYNFACERRDWEDKLIDLMIGFEALFSQELGEINYRLSLRAAFFIEYGDRKIIREFIKKCYDLRSKVVHGNLAKREIKIGELMFGEKQIIIELKSLLREAINKCFNKYTTETIDNLIPDIDSKIIEGK